MVHLLNIGSGRGGGGRVAAAPPPLPVEGEYIKPPLYKVNDITLIIYSVCVHACSNQDVLSTSLYV